MEDKRKFKVSVKFIHYYYFYYKELLLEQTVSKLKDFCLPLLRTDLMFLKKITTEVNEQGVLNTFKPTESGYEIQSIKRNTRSRGSRALNSNCSCS